LYYTQVFEISNYWKIRTIGSFNKKSLPALNNVGRSGGMKKTGPVGWRPQMKPLIEHFAF
jgi:hypothetical protein